jgi:predicted transcriptional regulator
MDRRALGQWLEQGLSLPQIGKLVGRPAPTVGYWVSKYGLVANGRDKYAPRGAVDARELEELIEHGLTLQRIANELKVSEWTVRYWIERYTLPRPAEIRREHTLGALRAGSARRHCPHHGTAELFVDRLGRRLQCKQCRSEAVARITWILRPSRSALPARDSPGRLMSFEPRHQSASFSAPTAMPR